MTKITCWVQHKKRIEAEKNGRKDRKALYKLINNSVYEKAMENLRNRINIKPAYTGMFILELSKTLMYEFHYDYINNKYGNNSRLLFIDTGSLMYEIET